jgi:hypothetical protein
MNMDRAPIVVPAKGHFAHLLDTSFILNRHNHFDIGSIQRPLLTREVIEEIRSCPDVMFNSYLDALLPHSRVVSRRAFQCRGLCELYDYVYAAASTLAPAMNRRISELDTLLLSPIEKYRRAAMLAQEVSEKTFLWHQNHCRMTGESDLYPSLAAARAEKPQRFVRTIRSQARPLHRAWFKYHRERFAALKDNAYRWTDERIVAAAVCIAMAERKISIIHTEDLDFVIVLWQMTDNMILESCNRDTEGYAPADRKRAVTELYAERGRALEAWRKAEIIRREPSQEVVDSICQRYHPDDAEFIYATMLCDYGDVLIFHAKHKVGIHYLFPPSFCEDVLRRTGTILST